MASISDKAITKREENIPDHGRGQADPELALIKRTVAIDATDDELKLYLHDCKRRGVHPLDKLLHFTKRGGKYTPIVSIDLMRSRAAESGEMAGSDDAIFRPQSGKPDSATVTVYRITNGTRYPYSGTARMSEYYVNGAVWNKMPHVMLAKCAEAIALRKAFPQQLAGLYTREEMDQAADEDKPAPVQAGMKTITAGPVNYPPPQQAVQAAPEPEPNPAPPDWLKSSTQEPPAAAATEPTLEDRARAEAKLGEWKFIRWYNFRTEAEKKALSLIGNELRDLMNDADLGAEQ